MKDVMWFWVKGDLVLGLGRNDSGLRDTVMNVE